MTSLSEKPSPRVDRLSADNPAGDKSPLTGTAPIASNSDNKPPRTFWDSLPPWITSNIRSSRSRKMLLRCWICSWAAYILLLPNASLRTLGNAAFFGFLASFMLPANMPVQLFLFVLTTVITGLCLGWAFGAAGMRAALAARDQTVLKESLLREQQSVAGLANPDALFQADIFQGKFLDTRSTVVFGVFLGFGTFVFALIRSYAPKLILMSLFGTIALDIYCSYGPLFPFGQYTILNSVLTSIACYIAIGLVGIVLVFPETVNHATLVASSALIGKIKTLVDLQQQVLESSPDDLARGSELFTKLQGMRVGILGQVQQMSASLKFINVEFSWGKWNGDDVKALQQPLLAVVSRSAALQSFVNVAGHRWTREPYHDAPDSAESSSVSLGSSDPSKTAAVGDSHLLRQLRRQNYNAEARHSVRITDVMPLLEDVTAELRGACSGGLGIVQAVLDNINTRRYNFRKRATYRAEATALVSELDGAVERLRTALHDFSESRRLLLIEPFEPILKQTKLDSPMPLRSLYIAYVFSANLIVLSEAVLALAELVQATASKRTRSRLWGPAGLRALVTAMTSRGDVSEQAAGEDTVPQASQEVQKEERTYKLDPDSQPPTNAIQRVANTIHKLYKWTKTAEALFCFKYVIVSIALWIPAVCRTSAHFIYVEKGLWALIMAQTTLNVYASDQIFNYFMRILGTLLGAIVGMLVWYIGDAKSNGSPYGSAASVAVFLVPILFLRLFAPPQILPAVLLFVATFGLVVGYSWIDGNLPVAGNPGLGWTIAWKRFVQVMIGCAASFVLMMLPPKSGRKAVRLRNAGTIATLSFLYADILSAWIAGEDRVAQDKHARYLVEWIPGFRDRLLALSAQIQAVRTSTALAKWEGSIRGRWPSDQYARLADVQSEMVANLALLGGALSQIDADMRTSFLQHTRVLNPNFIADVMATFSIVSQALETGEPIPEAFHQNLLDRLHYHGMVGHHTFSAHGDGSPDAVHRQHTDSITRYEYMFYATAISAVLQLLDGLNELRSITVNLCGEIPLRGYAKWKDEYDRAHLMTHPY